MTNHWIDLQNSKTILVEGSNVAENHPMAFKWIRKAQENGAKIIHVDPRFTRTSATADVYARIRPGTDAAFQNTMINHILVNKLYDEDYVTTHTNALFWLYLLRDDGELAGPTISNIKTMIGTIYNWAQFEGLVTTNPAAGWRLEDVGSEYVPVIVNPEQVK